jgi:hypothetical protein
MTLFAKSIGKKTARFDLDDVFTGGAARALASLGPNNSLQVHLEDEDQEICMVFRDSGYPYWRCTESETANVSIENEVEDGKESMAFTAKTRKGTKIEEYIYAAEDSKSSEEDSTEKKRPHLYPRVRMRKPYIQKCKRCLPDPQSDILVTHFS